MTIPSSHCVSALLSTLSNSNTVYAVERGLEEISTSCHGDLDILTRKQDFPHIIAVAERMGILVSVTLAYGGARIFVSNSDGYCKRIDFDWRIHFKGIPLTDIERLLNTRRETAGTSVLADSAHAVVVHAIKTAYGGAQKYRDLLDQHKLPLLSHIQRRRWLNSLVLSHPFASITGMMRAFFCYLLRFIWPSGLTIAVRDNSTLGQNKTARYLFQNRVLSDCRLFRKLRAHVRSELLLCKPGQNVDLDLSRQDDSAAVKTLITHLKHHRTSLPKLIFWLS